MTAAAVTAAAVTTAATAASFAGLVLTGIHWGGVRHKTRYPRTQRCSGIVHLRFMY